jgi:hypothetical protein
VIRRAAGLYRARFLLYIALIAIPSVPVGLAIVALAAASPDPHGQSEQILAIALAAQYLLVMPICTAAVAYAVVAQLDGRDTSLREVLRVVLPRSSVLVGTVLLSAVLTFLGLIALVIPGLVMAIWFQFVGQVVILEGGSYLEALRRCRELVRGVWWRTFGRVAAVTLIGGAVSFLVSTLIAGGVRPQDATDRSDLVVPIAANIPASILVLPFTTIALTLIYLGLRRGKPAA